MQCEQCKQREATTHIRRIVNGVGEDLHLCAICAQSAGLGALAAPGFSLNLGELFSGILGSSAAAQGTAQTPGKRCDFCGSSMREIISSGHTGCAKCYETFYDQLEPTLQRVHGAHQHDMLRHKGKTPAADPETQSRLQKEKTLANLRDQITAAVREENYEAAAELRDKIRELEEGNGHGGNL